MSERAPTPASPTAKTAEGAASAAKTRNKPALKLYNTSGLDAHDALLATSLAAKPELIPSSSAITSSVDVPLAVRKPQQRNIDDDDQARAQLTHFLLHQLAPRLGLDSSQIEIKVNQQAAQELDAAQAVGLQQGQKILLHPAHYAPEKTTGRYLLAHELVHLAQRRINAPKEMPALEMQQASAEQEARQLGLALAEQGPISAVQTWLPAHSLAFAASLADAQKSLNAQVAVGRQREKEAIVAHLRGVWVSDGDVFKVLAILDHFSFAVAVAIVSSLDIADRSALIDNLNPPHMEESRRSVLACLSAIASNVERKLIDLSIFRNLTDHEMAEEEYEAAVVVVRGLLPEQRRQIFEYKDALVAQRMMFAPALDGDAIARILKKQARALSQEKALAEKMQAVKQQQQNPKTVALQQRVFELLQGQGDAKGKDKAANASAALQALTDCKDEASIAAIAIMLEQADLLESFLENIAQSNWLEHKEQEKTLRTIVQIRLPQRNADLVEKLLSVGIFDWMVREYETRLAYLILQLLPMAQQYQFQRREDGKWFYRLKEKVAALNAGTANKLGRALPQLRRADKDAKRRLARSHAELSFEETDEEDFLYDITPLYQKKLQAPNNRRLLDDLIAEIKEARQGAFDERKVQLLYVQVASIGAADPSRETPTDTTSPSAAEQILPTTDYVLRQAIVAELDERGDIDWMLSVLSLGYLFSSRNAQITSDLLLARDPGKLSHHAKTLVEGFSYWYNSDKEAYLAYLCVQALPAAERKAFLRNNPKLWANINSALSPAQRQMRFLTPYRASEDGRERGGVLLHLLDPNLWTEDNAAILESQILLAITMRENEFVFRQSKKMLDMPGVTPGKNLSVIVDRYSLWKRGVRTNYAEATAEGTHGYNKSPIGTIKYIFGDLVAALWNTRILYAERGTAVKVRLNGVADAIGGDVAGMQLAEPPTETSNQIYLHLDDNLKTAELNLPNLVIAQAQMQLEGGGTIKFGQANLRQLRVFVNFDSNDLDNPVRAAISIAGMDLSALTYASADSAVAIGNLNATAFKASTSELSDAHMSGAPHQEKLGIPIPILLPIYLPHLIAAALVAAPIVGTIAAAGGLNQQSKKDEIVNTLRKHAQQIELSLGVLTIDALATTGGLQTGKIAMHHARLGVGLDRASSLAMELASVKHRLLFLQGQPNAGADIAALEKRKSELEAILPSEQAKARRLRELRFIIAQGGNDLEKLAELQQEFDSYHSQQESRSFLDINQIEIASVDTGTLKTKEKIAINGIHGEGKSGTIQQAIAPKVDANPEELGARPDPILSAASSGEFTIGLRDFNTGAIDVYGAAQTVVEIEDRLERLRNSGKEKSEGYKKLQTLLVQARRYDAYLQRGVGNLDAADLMYVNYLRETLGNSLNLTLDAISAQNARLRFNLADGTAGFDAEKFSILNILTSSGTAIKKLEAEQLQLDLNAGSNLLHFQKWRKYLKSGSLKASVLKASGLTHADSGTEIQSLTFNNPAAVLTTGRSGENEEESADASVRLSAGGKAPDGTPLPGIVIEGANVLFSEAVLVSTLHHLQAYDPTQLSPEKRKTRKEMIADVQATLSTLDKLRKAVAADAAELQAAKTPKAKASAEKKLTRDSNKLAEWRNQIEAKTMRIFGLDVALLGLGDITDPDFSVEDLLQKGISYTGMGGSDAANGEAGPGKAERIFENLEIEDVGVRTGSKKGKAKTINTGALKGHGFYSKTLITFVGTLDSISLKDASYVGPDSRIWCKQEAKITDIKLDLALHTPEDIDGKKQDKKLVVNEFSFGKFAGKQIGYAGRSSMGQLRIEMGYGELLDVSLKDVDVKLPASEIEKALVTDMPGKDQAGLHIGAATIGLVAKVGSDLRGNAKLKARGLHVHFLSDGGHKVSLASLSLAADMFAQDKGKEVANLHLDSNIKGLNVSLSTGSKLISFSARNANMHAKGNVMGNEFDAVMKNARVGNIVITDDAYLIRGIGVESLALQKLVMQHPDYNLLVRNGGVAEMKGLKLDMDVKRNPYAKEGESKIKKIVLRRLEVPETNLTNCKLIVKATEKLHLEIDIPKGKSVSLLGMRVNLPENKADKFSLTPGKEWKIEGHFEIGKLLTAGTLFHLGDMFDGSADLAGEEFKLDFLKEGGTQLRLKNMTAREVIATLNGGDLRIAATPTNRSAKVELRTLFMEQGLLGRKEMHVSAEALSAVGASYIKKASKPDEENLAVFFGAWLEDLHYHKFESGNQFVSSNIVDGYAIGNYGTQYFDLNLKDASTGTVAITDTEILAPEVRFGELGLGKFNVQSNGMEFATEAGGYAKMQNIRVDVKVQLSAPGTEAEKGDAKKSRVEKIWLRRFSVPTTRIKRMRIRIPTADSGTVELSMPTDNEAILGGMELRPGSDAQGFAITPSNEAKIDGALDFASFVTKDLRVLIPEQIDAKANLDVTKFHLQFIADAKQKYRIELENLKASEIEGKIYGKNKRADETSLFKLTRLSSGDPNAGIELKKVVVAEDGSVSIGEINVTGASYDNPNIGEGLHIGLGRLSLRGDQAGLKYANNKVEIDDLTIDQARFRINNLMKLGSGGGDSAEINPEIFNFLDKLNGNIEFNLNLEYNSGKISFFAPGTVKLKLQMVDGAINYVQLEDQLLNDASLIHHLIDFDYRDGKFMVRLDLQIVGALIGARFAGPRGALAGGAIGGTPLKSWNLTPAEQKRAAQGDIPIKALLRKQPGEKPEVKQEKTGDDTLSKIVVSGSNVNLSLKGGSVIDLAHLNKNNLKGKIKLGNTEKNAVENFTITGDSHGADGWKASESGLSLGIGSMHFSIEDLAYTGEAKDIPNSASDPTASGKKEATSIVTNIGSIELGSLNPASLKFTDNIEAKAGGAGKAALPKLLEGTANKAHAKDISIKISKQVIDKAQEEKK